MGYVIGYAIRIDDASGLNVVFFCGNPTPLTWFIAQLL